MSRSRSTPPSAQAAVSSGGGCLSGYLVPPLAVILVGFLLASFLPGSIRDPAPASPGGTPLPGTQEAGQAAPLAPVFTPQVQYWAASIRTWAAGAGLDPNLVATVMQIESCGDPAARSRAGAMGLFQVMPYHFLGTDDPYDPETNARRGLAYLKRSLEAAGGEARLALAGYNGGISVIQRGESTWAAETQRYAYWGNGIYADATSGAGQSPRLQEWLDAGGASMCRRAGLKLGIAP